MDPFRVSLPRNVNEKCLSLSSPLSGESLDPLDSTSSPFLTFQKIVLLCFRRHSVIPDGWGEYVVYHVNVVPLQPLAPWVIYRRFSDFKTLQVWLGQFSSWRETNASPPFLSLSFLMMPHITQLKFTHVHVFCKQEKLHHDLRRKLDARACEKLRARFPLPYDSMASLFPWLQAELRKERCASLSVW